MGCGATMEKENMAKIMSTERMKSRYGIKCWFAAVFG